MKKTILTYGLLIGLVSAISSYLTLNSIGSLWTISGVSFLLCIILLILAGKSYKSNNNGFGSFKDLFLAIFGAAAVGVLISFIVSFINISMMSDEKKEEISERFVDGQVETYEKLGLDPELVEEKLEEQAASMFSTKSLIMGPVFSGLIYLVIGLIMALIMKKEKPIQDLL